MELFEMIQAGIKAHDELMLIAEAPKEVKQEYSEEANG